MNNLELEQLINQKLSSDKINDYAPNGLQVEGKTEIKKIITGVTASQALIDYAISQNADAILVHHGYFWKSENPCIRGMKGKRIKALLVNDINLYGYHLPLDVHPELGNNAQLAKLLDIENLQPVEMLMKEYDDEGKECGEKWEKINKSDALWTRSKNDVSDEEYKAFYKHLSHDFADPVTWAHNKVEGNQAYTSLLYVPAKAPWDLFNREHKHGLKLYVQRVFIMDDAEQFMPNYLRFMRGLIDSNDLPLNVSREILQDNKITAALRKALTKRSLQMLEKLAKDDAEKYLQFWKEFGLVLKEGPAEDFANKETIAKLLRFASTHNDGSEQTVSLEDYILRMKEGQKAIYYITADSYVAAKNSPHLELFNKKGIEVLLLSDRIDEWMLSYLTEFDGKQLQSITKADLDLGDLADKESETQKQQDEAFGSFIERVKNLLGERVKTVRLTHNLTDTPAVVSTDNDQMTTQMAKLFAAAGQPVPEVKYTFELNPEHHLVKKVADIADETEFADWVELLLEQAMLAERGSLENPAAFIKRINKLLG